MGTQRNRSEAGFTLLEVIIALAILCASLAVFYQAFGTSARLDRRSEESARAAIFAESKMALMGVAEPLEPGSESGSEEPNMTWTVEKELVAGGDEDAGSRYATYQVTIDVSFGKRKELELVSLRQGLR